MWTIAAASVRGRGHEQTGTVCQDSSVVSLSPNGHWVALVASDGAGTAKYSDVGSRLVVDEIAKCLIRISEEIDQKAPGAWVSDRLIQSVVAIRQQLRDVAGSDNISDYHCTLSAALVGPTGGLTIHLGDGAIFGGAAQQSLGDSLDLAQGCFVSAPQNGEYANETYFLTERNWLKHLRIHPVSAVDWIVLGTDGGMSLAMVGESKPKTGFVVPVIQAMLNEPDVESRCQALTRILDDRQADRLTNDDKTLVVAVRAPIRKVVGDFGAATTQPAPQAPILSNDFPGKDTKNPDLQLEPSQPIDSRGASDESGTVKIPAKAPRNKKNRKWIWVSLGLASAVTLGVLGALVYRQYVGADQEKAIHKPAETKTLANVEAIKIRDRATVESVSSNVGNPVAPLTAQDSPPPKVGVSESPPPLGGTTALPKASTPVTSPKTSDATPSKATASKTPVPQGNDSKVLSRPVDVPKQPGTNQESSR